MKHRLRLRPRFRFAIVFVVVLLLATSAFAAAVHFGLVDFFNRTNRKMPQAAEYLIETAIPQQTAKPTAELVQFSVREAVCNTEQFYVVIEARPVNPEKYLLLSLDSMPGDPVSNAGIAGVSGTFKELAQKEGKKLLHVDAMIELAGKPASDTADYIMESDGTIVLKLSGKGPGTQGRQEFTCATSVAPYDENDSYTMGDIVRSSFTFTPNVTAPSDVSIYTQEHPSVVEGTGVVVESVEFKSSALETYAVLTFVLDPSATEAQKKGAADYLWFEYIDADGNRLEDGLSGVGTVEAVGGGRFVQKTALKALTPLPDTVTVRAFDCWEKKRFGSVTLTRQ